MSTKKFVNTVEASKLLHKTPQTLRNDRYMKRGVDFYKVGRKVFYAVSDIEEYLKSFKVSIP